MAPQKNLDALFARKGPRNFPKVDTIVSDPAVSGLGFPLYKIGEIPFGDIKGNAYLCSVKLFKK